MDRSVTRSPESSPANPLLVRRFQTSCQLVAGTMAAAKIKRRSFMSPAKKAPHGSTFRRLVGRLHRGRVPRLLRGIILIF
jgi:hypothetical protein